MKKALLVLCAVIMGTAFANDKEKPPEDRWIVGGDFIYWTMRQIHTNPEATTRAGQDDIVAGPGNDPNLIVFTSGPSSHSDNSNDFGPGFKIYLGGFFADYKWDTLVRYTWLQTKNKLRASTNDQEGINVGGLSLLATRSNGTNKYYFNNFDWEIGRNFLAGSSFQVRPFSGLKGGWYIVRANTNYFGDFIDDDGLSANGVLSKSVSSAKVDTWWIGIRNGLDLKFLYNKHWNLFGKTAFSGIWERIKSRQETLVSLTAEGSTTGEASNNITTDLFLTRRQIFTGVLEFNIGLGYDYMWETSNTNLSVTAGWEGQLWLNQKAGGTGTLRSIDGNDIFMQGLTLGFKVDF